MQISRVSPSPTWLWITAACLALGPVVHSLPAAAADRFRAEFEGAAAWQTRNDFAVPGDLGTRVRIDRTGSPAVAAGRVTIVAGLGDRWALRALAAPLRVTTAFTPSAPVRFQDVTFPAGVPIDHEYVFNSYRATIFRRFAIRSRSELRLGFTAKIRDAKLELVSGAITRVEADLGFVPLIYAGARLASLSSFALDLDIDAAGAPQGYAVDGSVRLMKSLGGSVELFAGYRILDGGADVDRVYSFARFHYATAGIAFGM